MKLLWVKSDFLHPTTRGGQIRTLETLRCLHRRHEIHYLAFRAPGEQEGVKRSGEYCSRAYPIDFEAVSKTSWKFPAQLASGLFDPVPLAVSRYRSAAMRARIAEVMVQEHFDRVVCDFLVPAVNFPSLQGVVLFEHNVESMIWKRRVQHARNMLERMYLGAQTSRMLAFERRACLDCAGVIAVSEADAKSMRDLFGLARVDFVPTGVNVEYFTPPAEIPPVDKDLIFLGSMDWAPNIDGMVDFVRATLPLIRRERPHTTLMIVGRDPAPEIRQLAERDPRITVTGTVDDVRPYLWRSRVSIVPLRIGGGTRLKIYEAMAARVATVSTTVGAEGLDAGPAEIRLADDAPSFARECLHLLNENAARETLAASAWKLVNDRFSWDGVARRFEELLDRFTPASGTR